MFVNKMENMLVGILLLMLLYCPEMECLKINDVLSLTPPPSLDIAKRSKRGHADLVHGGDIQIEMDDTFEKLKPQSCRRVKKLHYLGDRVRNCTSMRPWPITSCVGLCFPQSLLINPMTYEKLLEQSRKNYKCTAGRTVWKKVTIYCPDDNSLTQYRIKVIKNCKCVQLNNFMFGTSDHDTSNNDRIDKETQLFRKRMLKLKRIYKIQ